MKRNPTDEEAIEIGLLSFRVNYWLFISGMFFGKASLCGLFMLMAGMYHPTLGMIACISLMGSLGCYQYRSHLQGKLRELIDKLNGVSQ